MARLEDELVRAVTLRSDVSVCAFVGTDLARAATTRFAMSPTATMALGRALLGAVLLSTGTKHGQTLQLQFRGDGPLGTVFAISDSEGLARGTVQNPMANAPPRDGAVDVAAGVGQGMLFVVRNHPSWREPHTGIVRLETGEIAKDLAKYLTESEQIPSAMGLGVSFGPGMAEVAACGFLVQALPGATDDELTQVEENIEALPGLTSLLENPITPDDLIDRLLIDLGSRDRVQGQKKAGWLRSRSVAPTFCTR
jgi:molecular chaperone Hsp33